MVRLFLLLASLHFISPGSWRPEPTTGPWVLPTLLPPVLLLLLRGTEAHNPTHLNLRRVEVCLLGRNRGRPQRAPPPTPPRLWDVEVAGTKAANRSSRNRSPRRACWLVRSPTRQGARAVPKASRTVAATPWRSSQPAPRTGPMPTNPKLPWRKEGATRDPGLDSGGFKHFNFVNG